MEKKQYIDIEFVKFIMEKTGLDIKTMAQSMGLSPQTVKKYLDGADQSNISADLPIRFAKALDVPVVRLIHRDYCYPHKKN